MDFKREKLIDELRKHVAAFIQSESNKTSMITITNIDLAKDFNSARFFVTVFPENGEDGAMDFLVRNQRDAREYLKSKARLSRIPFVTFHLDRGEKSRQNLDNISSNL